MKWRGIMEAVIALILAIAVETGVPPYFALSVALEENRTLDPFAVNINVDGTLDRGIMQLNSSWFNGDDWRDPEANIRAGCLLIAWLMAKPELMTYWEVACAYNCGYWRYIRGWPPPEPTIEYAARVMYRWTGMEPGKSALIRRR